MNKTLVELIAAVSLLVGCDKKETVTLDAQTIKRYDSLRAKYSKQVDRWDDLDKELGSMLKQHSWPENTYVCTLWKMAADGSYVFPEDNNGKGGYMFTIAIIQNAQESRLKLVFGEDGAWLNNSPDNEAAVGKYNLAGVISKLQNSIKE